MWNVVSLCKCKPVVQKTYLDFLLVASYIIEVSDQNGQQFPAYFQNVGKYSWIREKFAFTLCFWQISIKLYISRNIRAYVQMKSILSFL